MRSNILFLALSALLAAHAIRAAEEIEVRTFPDGYKDCRVGSIFSDAPSVLILHTWAKEKKIRIRDVKLRLSLPENCKISRFSVTRKPRPDSAVVPEQKTENGFREWVLNAGNVNFSSVYALSKHPWRPEVPWTDSAMILFLRPEGTIPETFEVKWEISGNHLETVSGVMKLRTMPAPKLTKHPKNKSAWTTIGIYRQAWDRRNYLDFLTLLHNAGITGIMETGGSWLPDELYPVKDLPKLGFLPVSCQVFGYSQRPEPEVMRGAGFAVREEDCILDAGGKRQISSKRKTIRPNIYCFTAMGEKDSPVRGYMRTFYRNYLDRGFRSFFTDYEPEPYNTCYCGKCRRAFAGFVKADPKECMKLSPGELVQRYPLEWYQFRCHSIGKVLELLRLELGTEIGWNSNLAYHDYYLPAYGSYGLVLWAEDPRIFDRYISYHNADTLGTALEGIYASEAFLQKREDGRFALEKPVIVRATSLHWVNWGFHCIYGRYDHARNNGFNGLGTDYRRNLHKLEIAQNYAIGASGVEVSAAPFVADAEALTGITEGIQYAADFEDHLERRYRVDRKDLRLFDCTGTPSPYTEITRKGFLSNWFRQAAEKYGNLQIVAHSDGNWKLFTLFNWDYYQAKKLRFEPGKLSAKQYFVNISRNNEKYTLEKPLPAEVLERGVSVEVPAGGFTAVLLSENKRYPLRKETLPEFQTGTLVKPYLPGLIREGNTPFLRNIFNPQMKRLNQIYPNAKFREIAVEDKEGI